MTLPKYMPPMKIIYNGKEWDKYSPIRMEMMNAITGERTFAGWYYRFPGEPQDVSEEKVSISPTELINNL